VDVRLHSIHIQVERKQLTLDLKENPQGKFLRITEEVHGWHNAIVIPVTGLEQFRDALNEAINLARSPAITGNTSSAVAREL
jgi:hypothetical protein